MKIYIRFLENFELYDKDLQKFLVSLSFIQDFLKIQDIELPNDKLIKFNLIFQSFKSANYNFDSKSFYGLRLPKILFNQFLIYNFHKYTYDNVSNLLIIPKKLIKISDIDLNNSYISTQETLFSSDNTKLRKLLEPILQRYKGNLLNRTLFNNNYPIKTIIDKQVMFKMMSDFCNNNKEFEESKINLEGYCINPNLAKYVGCKILSTQEILSILGLDIKEIKKYLINLQKIDYQVILGGFGGAMTNFTYWLEEFCKLTEINYIFSHLLIYEYDKLELTNLFRIPLDTMSSNDFHTSVFGSKLSLAHSLTYCAKEIEIIPSVVCYNTLQNRLYSNKHTILIGSLSSQTRFNETIIPRIIPLHSDNDIIIYSNLKNLSTSNLIVESYGNIELTYFFLNMVLMTWEIIKELVDNKDSYKMSEENPLEQKEIVKFSSESWEFKNTQKTNYCLL